MWRGTQPLVAVIVGISLTEDSALARSEDAPAPTVMADEATSLPKKLAKVSSVPPHVAGCLCLCAHLRCGRW